MSTFDTSVSDPCNFWRPGGVYHFISFQKLTYTFKALISASSSCLKSFLWGSRITVSCQVRKKKKGIYPTWVHSYRQSNFQKGLSPNCQEITSSGWHGDKPLTERQACGICWGGCRRQGAYWFEATLQPSELYALVYILMVVVLTWLYPWVKTDQVIHQNHHQQKTRGLMVLKMPSLEGKWSQTKL